MWHNIILKNHSVGQPITNMASCMNNKNETKHKHLYHPTTTKPGMDDPSISDGQPWDNQSRPKGATVLLHMVMDSYVMVTVTKLGMVGVVDSLRARSSRYGDQGLCLF